MKTIKYSLLVILLISTYFLNAQIVSSIGVKTGFSKTELFFSNNLRKGSPSFNVFGQFQIVFFEDDKWEMPFNIGYINKESKISTGPAFYQPFYNHSTFTYEYIASDIGLTRKFPIKWFVPYITASFRYDRLVYYDDDEDTYYGVNRFPNKYSIGMISTFGICLKLKKFKISTEISYNLNDNSIYSDRSTVKDKTTKLGIVLSYVFQEKQHHIKGK